MGKEPPEARGRKRGAFPPPLRRSCAALGNGAALPGRLLLVRRLRLLTFRARGAIFLMQAGRRLAFGMDEEPPEARCLRLVIFGARGKTRKAPVLE